MHKIIVHLISRLRTGSSGVRIPAGQEIFPFSNASRQAMGSYQPSVHWAPGFFVGVEQPMRDDDDLLLSSAEVENAWSYA